MADILTNYRIGAEKQFLFLGKERIIGAQSLSLNPDSSLQELKYLGIGNKQTFFIPQREQSASFSIDSFLLNKDFFISHVTGTELTNAYILRSPSDLTTCYSLLSGYFTSYQCNYNIGSVPTINTNFIAFQNAGIIQTGSMTNDQVNDLDFISTGNHDITGVLVPYGNSVTLNINEFNTNRVQSFNISLNTIKTPIYHMGSRFPKRIDISAPINVECSFSFEQGDYIPIQLRNIPSGSIIKSLNLVVRDYNTDDVITTYSFSNLNLVNESLSVGVGNEVTINQIYKGVLYA